MANNYTSCSMAWHITNPQGIEKVLDLFRDWCEDRITLDALIEVSKIDVPDMWEKESENIATFKEGLIYTVNLFELEKNKSSLEGSKFLPYGDIVEEGGDVLTFATEELNVDEFAFVAQALISLESKDVCWRLPFASTCDQLRIGEFGGGVVSVTKEQTEVWAVEPLFDAYRALRDEGKSGK